jgi:hypothetical protein
MKKFSIYFILAVPVALFFHSCSPTGNNPETKAGRQPTDTLEMIRGFIYGLWSKDSENTLQNVGYYFRPDGTMDFVAAGVSGSWALPQRDTLQITYSDQNQQYNANYRIDTLSESRMLIRDGDGSYLFRKVPFGMNVEGLVLQGFSGSLFPGEEKEYAFDLPAAKKITLKLNTKSKDVVFRIFDNQEELTSMPLQEWTGILVRSGKYKATVTNTNKRKQEKQADFDLKIIGF